MFYHLRESLVMLYSTHLRDCFMRDSRMCYSIVKDHYVHVNLMRMQVGVNILLSFPIAL